MKLHKNSLKKEILQKMLLKIIRFLRLQTLPLLFCLRQILGEVLKQMVIE
jgi:hypothetical protein